LPTLARAEVLTFRNDTGQPIVLQAAATQRGAVQRDRPNPLKPTETCRVNLPGNKLITIYDPRMPNQVLFQTTVPAGSEDLSFSVRLEKGKVTIEQVKQPGRGPGGPRPGGPGGKS
jgi:hypothetical protein